MSEKYDGFILPGTGGDAAHIAENVIKNLRVAVEAMDPGDVFAISMTFNLKQSAVLKTADEMRNELIRQLRAVATHLAS